MTSRTLKRITSQRFYNQPTLKLARALLGRVLETCVNGKKVSGIITEVEAYRGDVDPACHSYKRRTLRTEVMYQDAGHIYVYFIYGAHFCVNIVSERKDFGAAVLIRALKPLAGLKMAQKRRGTKNEQLLMNGPGKICQALAIGKKFNGEHLSKSRVIRLYRYLNIRPAQIKISTRIGITKGRDLPWRFWIDKVW